MIENSKKIFNNIIRYFVLFVFAITMLSCFIRLFFSAELTDEAYAIAESYMVSEGALPFVNNWSQVPGFTLLIAPFIWLYTTITGGTTAIVLYARIAAYFLTLICLVFVFWVLKFQIRSVEDRLLYVTPFIIPFFFSMTAFRADKPALLLMWVAGILASVSQNNDRKEEIYLFITGICAALSALCYTQMIAACIIIAVILLITDYYNRRSFKRFLYYAAGGITTAIIIILYLILRSSPEKLIEGIKYLLSDVAYFKIGNKDSSRVVFFIIQEMKYLKKISPLFLAWDLGVLIFILYKKDKDTARSAILLNFTLEVIGFILLRCLKFYRARSIYIILYTAFISYCVVPVYLCFIRKCYSIYRYLFNFLWIPSGIVFLLVVITTPSDAIGRTILLINGSLLIIPFALQAFKDNFDGINLKDLMIKSCLPLALSAVLIGAWVYDVYQYVYRDEHIPFLTKRVESGAYKGVYTTPERADGLIVLESIIKQYTDKTDRVLFMDCVPFGYLMTDAAPCAPSSWDQNLYTYGFMEDDLFMDYFRFTDTIPTKIIYVDYGRDEVWSIENEKYEFNAFVDQNYKSVYENRDITYPVIIYQHIDF